MPKHRVPAIGGGRKARSSEPSYKLFFILFKCYPTFDVAGLLFELHPNRAHRWMLKLQLLLEKALGRKMARYGERKEREYRAVHNYVSMSQRSDD